jgi:tetratricopeptide (TPR) repeat protein
MGNMTLDIPPGATDYRVEDSFTLPVDVELLGIRPHAHLLGKEIEAVVTLPNGGPRTLLRIPHWNFMWQEDFRFEEPVRLPRGSEIRARFRYDNSAANPRNPHQPPQRVRFGPRSSDEMGDLWLQLLATNPDDREELRRQAARKELELQRAFFEQQVSERPEEARTRDRLATVLSSLGETDPAIAQLERALELEPSARIRRNLASLLAARGSLEPAREHLLRAVELEPESALGRRKLANVLFQLGNPDLAFLHYREAVRLDPLDVESLANLGTIYAMRGQHAKALELFDRALAIEPENRTATQNRERVREQLDARS